MADIAIYPTLPIIISHNQQNLLPQASKILPLGIDLCNKVGNLKHKPLPVVSLLKQFQQLAVDHNNIHYSQLQAANHDNIQYFIC